MLTYGGEVFINDACLLLFILNTSSHMAYIKNFGNDDFL